MAAVELDEDGDPRHVHFDPIADYKGATFSDWAKSALHPTAPLIIDGRAIFNATGTRVAAHGAIIVGNHKFSELEPFRCVNTFISNAKTPIAVTCYHGFDLDTYRHRYLGVAQYRVNRRFDLASLVGAARTHTCVRTAPCPERWLGVVQVAAS